MAILEIDFTRKSNETSIPNAKLIEVIRAEDLHALIGLVGGLLIILIGGALVAGGFFNPDDSVIKWGTFELNTGWPGLIIAAMGLLVIYITRPKVVGRSR